LGSGFLQSNLQALAAVQPSFALPPFTGIVREDNGQWRVVRDGNAMAIHSGDPQRQADREASALLANGSELPLIAVVGIGLGFLLDGLERRGWKGRVLALEPEPDTLQPLLARRDWRAWIGEGRLRLLIGPEFANASDCRTLFGDGRVEPKVLVSPVLGRLDAQAEGRARAVVRRLHSDARSNAEARRKHGARYLLNTLANMRSLATEGDVASLAGAFPGVPAIVVGAGPSLDQALAHLREAQENAIVVSVDTALRPLLSAGIEPHFVVALDPGESNTRHLWELPPCDETFLVTEASMTPIALEHFRGRTFLFSVSDHQPWPWLNTLQQSRGRLRAWGSVLTSTYDLALRLGCDPVVFVGSDLAFTGNQPYARGVAYEEDWRRLADWGVPLETHWRDVMALWPHLEEPDINGVPTRTAAHLVTFRNWLVEQIGREKGRTIVNATGGGILHGPHVPQRALADLVASFERRQVSLQSVVRQRHRPVSGEKMLNAAKTLRDELSGLASMSPASEELLQTWERFADGVSRDRLARSLGAGLEDVDAPRERRLRSASAGKAEPSFDLESMTPLAANLDLVWFQVPPVRMEAIAPKTRMFRCRTTAARLIGCAVRMPDPAVTEDGEPLRRGASLEALQTGEYFIWRDEVHFNSTDDSDPRENGRVYAVLMPQCAAYLEQLPLHEILEHRL
jgi:hypothetical protein